MWVEKTSTGKYKYCDRYIDPVTGKTKKVTVTLDKNTKQAEKMAREILRQKMYAEPDPTKMSLSELIERYNTEQSQMIKASTYTRNAGVLGRVLRILGDVDVNKLSAGYVRRRFMDSGKSNTTLNEYLTRYKALMRWAYKYDYIQDIRSLDKLEPFPDATERQKVEDKFLEREELSALLEAMKCQLWHDVTAFLALSGLRIGEAAALTRSDVDLTERIIHVTKTYDHINHVTTTPKTYDSMRDVYIQDELLPLCRDLLHRSTIVQISGLLFFDSDGGHIHYDAYRMYLHKISKRVLGRVINPHTLRHTHASLLMEAGVSIEAISARLGHSDSRVTRDIYLHVTQKLEKQRNEQIKAVHII